MAVKCPKCHFENPGNIQFCVKCAAYLGPSQDISVTKTFKPTSKSEKENIVARKYVITEKIGEGGMGIVYKAEDIKLKRTVALKFLSPELTRDQESMERFVREAQVAAALNHPHICTIYEINEADGQTFISMEYIEGSNLKEELSSGPLSIDKVVDIGIQVAQGLKQAHTKGIIHRDIKPANIMINNEGQPKITDFGLAKLTGGVDLTKVSTIMGTIAYMSPEQARGENVDHRSDIWSLGVILYQMLTGHLPFKGENEASMLNSLLHKEPDPLNKHLKEIPKAWQGIINKALSKDIKNRYQDLQDLWNDLLHLKAGYPISQKAPMPTKAKIKKIVPVVALTILFTAVGYLLLNRYLPSGEGKSEPTLSLRTAITVLPFSYTGSDGHSELSVGIVDLLSVNLDGAGDIRCVDPRALLGYVGQESAEVTKVQFGKRVSQKFKADYFIMGSIVEAGGQYRINATLYDKEDTSQILSQANVGGKAEDLFALVDGLTTELLAGVAQTPKRRLSRIAAMTTNSLPALKAYLEGEKQLRAGNFILARDAFQKAVEEDETFALAWLRLSQVVFGWLGQYESGLEALNRAKKYSDRLSEHDRLRIEAHRAHFEGDYLSQKLNLEAILRDFPDDLDAREQLGNIYVQYGPILGKRLQETWDFFIQHLEYEPDDPSTYQKLAILALAQRKFDEFRVFKQKFLEFSPQHEWGWVLLAPVPFVTGDQEGKDRVLAEIAQGVPNIPWAITNTAFLCDLPSEALPMIQAYTPLLRNEAALSIANIWISCIKLSEGKKKAALDTLQVAGSYKSENAHIFGSVFATLPFVNLSQEELRKISENLDRWEPNPQPSQSVLEGFADYHDEINSQIRHYLIALLSIYLGELESARDYIDQLKAMESPPYAKPVILSLANSLLTLIRKNEGQLDEALHLLDQETPRIFWPHMWLSPFFSLAAQRYLRAEILYEMGRYEEALCWYKTFYFSYFYDILYRAGSYFRCGEIYEKLGRTEEAINSYSRFLKLWSECDPELLSIVEQARLQIEKLD